MRSSITFEQSAGPSLDIDFVYYVDLDDMEGSRTGFEGIKIQGCSRRATARKHSISRSSLVTGDLKANSGDGLDANMNKVGYRRKHILTTKARALTSEKPYNRHDVGKRNAEPTRVSTPGVPVTRPTATPN